MEKDKKKIKLITFAPHPNFGTCLQSYALNYVLRQMGHDVEFIFNCREAPPVHLHTWIWRKMKAFVKLCLPKTKVEEIKRRREADPTRRGFNMLSLPNLPVLRIISRLPFYPRLWKWYKCRDLQWRKVFKFTYEDGNFRMRRIFTHKEYEEVAKDTDMFITGSDQIWNPYCGGFNPMMFVEFGEGVKRIAYSSSISRSSFPPTLVDRVKADLSKFSHIGVRESHSVDLLNNLLERTDVRLVVDPTLLLSREEWSRFASRAVLEFPLPEKYIFCYCIGKKPKKQKIYEQMIREVMAMTGIKDVITLDCYRLHIAYGGGMCYSDAGPYEWVYLLEHASYVCMDSFHATAFALKFEKDFVHTMKHDDEDMGSANIRMYDILSRYGLLYKNYTPEGGDAWKRPVDYTKVTPLVQAEIDESLEFLKFEVEN